MWRRQKRGRQSMEKMQLFCLIPFISYKFLPFFYLTKSFAIGVSNRFQIITEIFQYRRVETESSENTLQKSNNTNFFRTETCFLLFWGKMFDLPTIQ